MVAVGNASLALATRESGAGAPPNKRPSSGCPTKVLKVRSVTMDGTPPATPTFSCLINLFFVVSFKSNIKTCMPSPDCCKGGGNKWSHCLSYLHGTKVVPSSTSHFLVITIFIPVIVAIIFDGRK